jgi:hypothetical protein
LAKFAGYDLDLLLGRGMVNDQQLFGQAFAEVFVRPDNKIDGQRGRGGFAAIDNLLNFNVSARL